MRRGEGRGLMEKGRESKKGRGRERKEEKQEREAKKGGRGQLEERVREGNGEKNGERGRGKMRREVRDRKIDLIRLVTVRKALDISGYFRLKFHKIN